MYISALLCALGTPSEFSSVPILVADELVLPFLVNHDPRANTLYRTYLSPERLPCSRDLVIRVTTTRNTPPRMQMATVVANFDGINLATTHATVTLSLSPRPQEGH